MIWPWISQMHSTFLKWLQLCVLKIPNFGAISCFCTSFRWFMFWKLHHGEWLLCLFLLIYRFYLHFFILPLRCWQLLRHFSMAYPLRFLTFLTFLSYFLYRWDWNSRCSPYFSEWFSLFFLSVVLYWKTKKHEYLA